jgi:hypothetical protein
LAEPLLRLRIAEFLSLAGDMAFNLSTPTAKLAFEMALRNQQAQDSSAPFDASARSFVSKALATGNDQLAPFEDIYRQYVDPAEAQRRAQAAAFNEYLVGLPELLSASAKELRASGSSGSGGGRLFNQSGVQRTPQEILQSLLTGMLPTRSTAVKSRTGKTNYGAEENRVSNVDRALRTVTARRM